MIDPKDVAGHFPEPLSGRRGVSRCSDSIYLLADWLAS